MLRTLTRMAVAKGLLGGSRRWLAAGTVAVGLRAVIRLAVKEEKVVYSEELSPGETLLIRHLPTHM